MSHEEPLAAAGEAPIALPVILDHRKDITPKKVYKKLKKQLKKRSKKKIVDFTILSVLILRCVRIAVKYAVPLEKLAEMLDAFVRLFGAEEVVLYIQRNPDYILDALKIVGRVALAAIEAAV